MICDLSSRTGCRRGDGRPQSSMLTRLNLRRSSHGRHLLPSPGIMEPLSATVLVTLARNAPACHSRVLNKPAINWAWHKYNVPSD